MVRFKPTLGIMVVTFVTALGGCIYSDSYTTSADAFDALGKATPSGAQLVKKDPQPVVRVDEDETKPTEVSDQEPVPENTPVVEPKPLVVDPKGSQPGGLKAGKNSKKKKKR